MEEILSCDENYIQRNDEDEIGTLPFVLKMKYPDKRYLHSMKNRRVLHKNGRPNVRMSEIPHKNRRYILDLGNTLINIRWRWILLSLCVCNFVAWSFYALLWMSLAVFNGDWDQNVNSTSCVVGTNNFAGYFLLSVETLTTIGFGVVYPGNCREAWIVLTLQVLTGVAIEGALVTAVYVKMSRPIKRNYQLFSKKAVICMRDGSYCLVFRIYDSERRYCSKTEIRAFLLHRVSTGEGEHIENFMQKLKLENYGLIMWPVEIVHVIDERSPLWQYSAQELLTNRMELMVVIQGDSITTGQPSQNTISYLNSEIHWGHRFAKCVDFEESEQKFRINRDMINATIPFDAPLCSASKFAELYRA